MAKIIKDDPLAATEKRCCFFCKRMFCYGYKHIVCSGCLPKMALLGFLMRSTAAPYTCARFKMSKYWREQMQKQQ